MDEIEDPFPRPFRSFVASRVDQRRRNDPPRPFENSQTLLNESNNLGSALASHYPPKRPSGALFDQNATVQQPHGGYEMENAGQPLNALHLTDQQPPHWEIYDFLDPSRDPNPQLDNTASQHAPVQEFGYLSFDNIETDIHQTTGDNQQNSNPNFHELIQDSAPPRQTSFPRRRSRYRFRREGQETRPYQVPASEISPSPLQRWRNSPPEEEAAPIAAILRTLGDRASLPDNTVTAPGEPRSRKSRSIAGSNTSSLSSGTSQRSSRSDRSTNSGRETRTQTRGRRRGHIEKKPVEKPRIFACTFCCDSFRNKYDWTRHEKSLHLNLETWTCAPSSGVFYSETGEQGEGEPRCAYCNFPNPSPEHLDEHKHSACSGESRVFARKDHLVQHLRVFHRLNNFLPPHLDKWRHEITPFSCRCGFCNARINSWKDRADHLSRHFRKGFTMRDWKGEHEFHPGYIETLLENFIPPYLIGDESRSQQPFSASDSKTRDHFDQISTHTVGLGRELEGNLAPTDEHLPDLNSGETQAQTEDENRDIDILPPRSFPDILARHLARFARANMQKGIIPTDDMFQLEARRVIYDCEDSWNQTIADNPDWMDSFRRQFQL